MRKKAATQRRVVTYIRVSSREQAEGYSVDAQLQKVTLFCEQSGLDIVRPFVEVESASKAGRPVFDEMISFVKRDPSIFAIVAHKYDRLTRNPQDKAALEGLKTCKLIAAEGGFADDPGGIFARDVMFAQARFYSMNLANEVKKGMHQKARKGGIAWHAPWGYTNTEGFPGCAPHQERAPVVRWLFERYAEGNVSIEALNKEFVAKGYAYRPSQPNPGRRIIEMILKNRFHTGEFEFEGERVKGAYEPLISVDLFNRVQAAFAARNRGSGSQGRDFTYRRLFACSCGCAITFERKKGKYVYGHCTHRNGPCEEPAVREEELERQIGLALLPFGKVNAEVVALARAAYQERSAKRSEGLAAERGALERRVVKLREFLKRSYEEKLEGTIDESLWKEKNKEWREELARVELRLGAPAAEDGAANAIRLLELTQSITPLWFTRTGPEKRKLLETLCSNSVLRGGKLGLEWRKPLDVVVEGPSIDGWWR